MWEVQKMVVDLMCHVKKIFLTNSMSHQVAGWLLEHLFCSAQTQSSQLRHRVNTGARFGKILGVQAWYNLGCEWTLLSNTRTRFGPVLPHRIQRVYLGQFRHVILQPLLDTSGMCFENVYIMFSFVFDCCSASNSIRKILVDVPGALVQDSIYWYFHTSFFPLNIDKTSRCFSESWRDAQTRYVRPSNCRRWSQKVTSGEQTTKCLGQLVQDSELLLNQLKKCRIQ